MPELTKRQAAILAFIESRPHAPTFREICREFGFRSVSGPMCHLLALEKKGYILRGPGDVRGIAVLRRRTPLPVLACHGTIGDGGRISWGSAG